ncbi:hypothetical protein MAPG_08568 [Magnaporthiopsis poae ATCC 64411]|uniref:Uncharacterized protein n=1 Tax=Magnaporthiopsis poae (strain ATCC 64411 / 73-15) TaxID=644358 RepID=A0A0C4E7P9_MAGP6|nr:hypothetical protein MAPG_08568 [Magnaporthiopsis poae ATCC 64411]
MLFFCEPGQPSIPLFPSECETAFLLGGEQPELGWGCKDWGRATAGTDGGRFIAMRRPCKPRQFTSAHST